MDQWVETDEGIVLLASKHFQQLFSSSHPENIDDTIRHIAVSVSHDMNLQLM